MIFCFRDHLPYMHKNQETVTTYEPMHSSRVLYSSKVIVIYIPIIHYKHDVTRGNINTGFKPALQQR